MIRKAISVVSILIICILSLSFLTASSEKTDGNSLKPASIVKNNTSSNNIATQLTELNLNNNLASFHFTFSGLDKYDAKLSDLVHKTIDGESILTPVNGLVPAKINVPNGFTLLSEE